MNSPVTTESPKQTTERNLSMSLDWDTTDIADRTTHFPPDENGLMNDALHVLIWISIPVGIDHITDANVDEFWMRTDIWQRVIGTGFTLVRDADTVEPFLLTQDHVRHAVGLRTNVSRKTRSEFLRDLSDRHQQIFPLD